MILTPHRISSLTLRILEAEGMHIFDCAQCRQSKIGPGERSVCLTCEPEKRELPLLHRKRPNGLCVHGHEMEGSNVYHRPDGFDECRICQGFTRSFTTCRDRKICDPFPIQPSSARLD